MMKRFISALVVLLYSVISVYAQQQGRAVLRFDTTTWDFGHISEAGGKVNHTFHFTNRHTSPIVIEEVISTCGCAVPVYSKQPIKPGNAGTITVTFDPKGRTNFFSKSIRVVANSGQSVNTLWVKGTINTINSIEDEYPYSLSSYILVDKMTLSYEQLQHNGRSKQQDIRIYNRSDKMVKLSYLLLDKSGCLSISMPSSLQGRSYATMKITASPLKGFYGTFKDKIIISANSVHSSPIQILGIVIDDMRKVSAATAPRLKCSQSYFNLGSISLKKHIQRKIKVTNEGGNPLIIRKIECPEFVSTNIRGEKVLKRNECLEVLFELNVSSSNQPFDAKVKLITNDAHQPVHTVIFEGEIGQQD